MQNNAHNKKKIVIERKIVRRRGHKRGTFLFDSVLTARETSSKCVIAEIVFFLPGLEVALVLFRQIKRNLALALVLSLELERSLALALALFE